MKLQYAPKDKQTDDLCRTPPFSFCDAAYGLSIGRGSFNFTPGGWTHTRQTVTLNTPGKTDGRFQLEVDGTTVINRTDIFYRDTIRSSSTTSPTVSPTDGGGLLSPLLGGVLDRLDIANLMPIREDGGDPVASLPLLPPASDPKQADLLATDDAAAGILQSILTQISTQIDTISTTATTSLEVEASSTVTITSYIFDSSAGPTLFRLQAAGTKPEPERPIGFTGLFFR